MRLSVVTAWVVCSNTTDAPHEYFDHAGVNAASFSGGLAPGALGSLFGSGLANTTYSSLFDSPSNHFVNTAGGVSVSVNGTLAPLPEEAAGAIPQGARVEFHVPAFP